MGEIDPTPIPRDWKEAMYRWLFSQGVSTILLVALVAGIWVGGPKGIAELKSYINDINTAHGLQIQRMAESFDKDQERDAQLLQAILKEKGLGDFTFPNRPHIASQPQ